MLSRSEKKCDRVVTCMNPEFPFQLADAKDRLSFMSTLEIDIRHLETADAGSLSEVFASAWDEAYRGIVPDVDLRRIASRRGPDYWTHVAQNAARQVLVLSLDNTARGYVTFGHNRHNRIPAQGEIYELYVDPVCQGAGLGRRLLDAARRKLAEQRRKGLVIWALAGNDRADNFYRRCGGHVAGEDNIRFFGRNYRRIAYLWQ